MYKLDLDKAEESEIKWSISIGSQKKQENSGKTSAYLTTLKTDCVEYNKVWKILREMGTPEHLTYLLRNLYEGHEAIVTTRHETTN